MRLPALVAALLMAALVPQNVAAEPPGAAPGVAMSAMSPEDRDFLLALESLAWVPDGPASDRQVYVISAPWCGYCRRLYNNTKDLADLQLRWIKTGARNAKHARQIAAASLSREPAALQAIYLGGTLPAVPDGPAAERIVDIHERAFSVLSEEIKQRTGGRWGFPTLVYATADGLRVTGASDDPASQLSDVLARPEARDLEPLAPRVANAEFATEPLEGTVVGTGAGDGAVRLLPGAHAPVITRLREGRGFDAQSKLTVDGELWYAVRVFRDGAPGYVRATDSALKPGSD